MATPPLPPQPPGGTPPPDNGGFGPPPRGYGPPPDGYGTLRGGGGYAGGGYGPPQDGGNWSSGRGGGEGMSPPPPPGPPGGRGPRRNTLFLVVAVVVALGVLVAVLLVLTHGGDSSDDKAPTDSDTRTSRAPAPSLSLPSKLPTELPSRLPSGLPSNFPTDFPSGFPSTLPSDLASLFAAPAGDETPYYMLKKGDCFDVDSSRPGQAARLSCREPHDAEVVRVVELEGTYASDTARSEAAAALCDRTLRRATAEQPAGTARGTLVQYPDTAMYDVGIDNVACSLVADAGGGSRKLPKPLT